MNEMIIFPSSVCAIDMNKQVDFSKIESEAYKIKKKYPTDNKSNINSYQSVDLVSLNLANYPHIKKLLKLVNENIKVFASNKINFDVNISNAWVNITEPGGYQTQHDHPNSVFSGSITIKKPAGSGNIVFVRSDNAKYFIPQQYHNQADYTQTTTWFDVPEGSSLFFCSWEKHYVEQNCSNEDRITLNFNTK